MSTVLERPMAKRNDVSVKMDPQVVDDCRIAAAFCGMTLAEYLSERMRVVSKKDIEEGYQARWTEARKPPKGQKP